MDIEKNEMDVFLDAAKSIGQDQPKGMEKSVMSVFLDSSGRPKITPRHEAAVTVILEEKYPPWKVRVAIQKLEESGHLSSVKKEIKGLGEAKFYFPARFVDEVSKQKILRKIEVLARWIKKYSGNKVTCMVGAHLHDVVRAHLRIMGFEIVSERTNRYLEKAWSETRQTLDIIARHKTRNLVIGVEIKNTLHLVPISEVTDKVRMCKHLGVIPVFACRWLEPHRNEIENSGGYLWQFKKQLYPRGQESFVEALRKRFKLPVEVNAELPASSIWEFENWLEQF